MAWPNSYDSTKHSEGRFDLIRVAKAGEAFIGSTSTDTIHLGQRAFFDCNLDPYNPRTDTLRRPTRQQTTQFKATAELHQASCGEVMNFVKLSMAPSQLQLKRTYDAFWYNLVQQVEADTFASPSKTQLVSVKSTMKWDKSGVTINPEWDSVLTDKEYATLITLGTAADTSATGALTLTATTYNRANDLVPGFHKCKNTTDNKNLGLIHPDSSMTMTTTATDRSVDERMRMHCRRLDVSATVILMQTDSASMGQANTESQIDSKTFVLYDLNDRTIQNTLGALGINFHIQNSERNGDSLTLTMGGSVDLGTTLSDTFVCTGTGIEFKQIGYN